MVSHEIAAAVPRQQQTLRSNDSTSDMTMNSPPRRIVVLHVYKDFHIYNSLFGSPIKLFEYMAIRRPIITTRIGQIATLLADRGTAPSSRQGMCGAFDGDSRCALLARSRSGNGGGCSSAGGSHAHLGQWARAVLARLGISNDTRQEVRDAIG